MGCRRWPASQPPPHLRRSCSDLNGPHVSPVRVGALLEPDRALTIDVGHVEEAQAPGAVGGEVHELVVRSRVHVGEALHLSDDALVLRSLPRGVGGVPACIVHEHPVPAGGQLPKVEQVRKGALMGMVTIYTDDVALDVWPGRVELGDRLARRAGDVLEPVLEEVLHQLRVPAGVGELADVKRVHGRLGIGVQEHCRGVAGIEAHLADVLHSGPARHVEVHAERLLARGDVPLRVDKIAASLPVEVQ
mmetsp:Transcript_49049/g.110297  ORF Transcript_49049/g.110297 Transcript_49049/m.110297 type:complete len:247 (-) Transcript_49049:256-996(-)